MIDRAMVDHGMGIFRGFAAQHDLGRPVEVRQADPYPRGSGIALFWPGGKATAIMIGLDHGDEYREILRLCREWMQ